MASGKVYYTNTLNKMLNAIINYSSSCTVNFTSAGGRYVLFAISATSAGREFGMVSCDSGGSVVYTSIFSATNPTITVTTGSRSLVITNTATTFRVNLLLITMSGDLPTTA